MAHALEVRSPFLDYRVVEFAYRLPVSLKLKGRTTKYLLRKAFEDRLPKSPLKRRKHGFAVPVGDWFKGSLKEPYRAAVLDASIPELIDPVTEREIFREHLEGKADHGHRLWILLFFHTWWRWWNG